MAKNGVELYPYDLVGLGAVGATFGVSDDDVSDAELCQHLGAHLAGEGAAILEMAGLGANGDRNRVRLDRRLHRSQRCEGRVQGHLAAIGRWGGAKNGGELLHELDRLVVVVRCV